MRARAARPGLVPAGLLLACAACAAPRTAEPEATGGRPLHEATRGRPLREARTLDLLAEEWVAVAFGGRGEVRAEEGGLLLEPGAPLTAVAWPRAGELARAAGGFEVELEAARLSGTDFFCGLTVPVGDASATVVVGGWGGALCGLSCVDGRDASDNPTRSFRRLENGRWYRLRVRVDENEVAAWLDGDPLLRQPRAGRRFEVRTELLPARPLSVAGYATRASVRSARLTLLGPGPDSGP